MRQARELGFRSINIDLMYGLPLQTVQSFSDTLDGVIEVRPDRLSVFNYAHLPERFKPQRRICCSQKHGTNRIVAELRQRTGCCKGNTVCLRFGHGTVSVKPITRYLAPEG